MSLNTAEVIIPLKAGTRKRAGMSPLKYAAGTAKTGMTNHLRLRSSWIVQEAALVTVLLFLCSVIGGSLSLAWSSETNNDLRRTPIVKAVEKVSPSVVNISTEETLEVRKSPFSGFGSKLFDEFFRDFYNVFPQENYKRQSLGSGVIIDAKGYILTNDHVTPREAKITVALSDKREYEAKLVGGDNRFDLAVLKIESKEPLPFVEMGRSDDLMIGEPVIAIGNPFGLSHTVSTGVISALNRTVRSQQNLLYSDLIQIDAPINPGNSGGPLVNIYGQVIGINTAIYQNAQGIGFAIPIDRAKRIISDLITYGEVPETWVGVVVQDLTPQISQYFGFKGKEGVLIAKIEKDSPAEKTDLKIGDILLAVNGQKITSQNDFTQKTILVAPGDQLKLEVFRSGREIIIELVAQKIPDNLASDIAWNRLGIALEEINPGLSRKYRLPNSDGLLIHKVRKGSAADTVGLEAGDLLKQIYRFSITDMNDFRKAIFKVRNLESVVVLIQRGARGYYVTLTP